MRLFSNPEGSGKYLPGFSMPIRALFIQLIAYGLTLFALQFMERFMDFSANLLVFALLQGVFATGISYLRKFRAWWLPIQFFFPIAMHLLLALHIPPGWYMGVFLVLLLLFWGAVVTRVPLYLSGREAWQKVAELIPDDKSQRFADIGSGLGGLVLYVAKEKPDCEVTGIEISPLLWLVSIFRKKVTKIRAHFVLGNYEKRTLAEYDVVFAYLSPVVMDRVWFKAQAEMKPGTLLLSLEFPVDEIDPDIAIPLGNRFLYGWYIRKISII